jgi:hypothetical protein
MIGVPKVRLFYSSTSDVCQYNVQIWEVKPGLEPRFVTRINYTDRHNKPGVIKEQIVEGSAYSHLFEQGDKIRIVFTNLDTQPADSFLTTNPYVLPILKKSYNTIYMGQSYSSFVEIPVIGSLSGIDIENDTINEFRLYQNYPNPFKDSTDIRFAIDKPAHVELELYNMHGKKVATILNGDMSAGTHGVPINVIHRKLPGGEYLYKMKIGNTVKRMKMLLLE